MLWWNNYPTPWPSPVSSCTRDFQVAVSLPGNFPPSLSRHILQSLNWDTATPRSLSWWCQAMITFLLWVLSMFYTNYHKPAFTMVALEIMFISFYIFSVLSTNTVFYIVLDVPDQRLEGAQCWLLCKMAFPRFRENLADSTISVCACVCLFVCVRVLSVSLCMCICIYICVLYVSLCMYLCVYTCVYLSVYMFLYVNEWWRTVTSWSTSQKVGLGYYGFRQIF